MPLSIVDEEVGTNKRSTTLQITNVTTSGTGRLLYVVVGGLRMGSGAGSTATSVTWDEGGQDEAFTRVGGVTPGSAFEPWVEIWRLVDPAVLTNATIDIVFATASITWDGGVGAAWSLDGVDTADPDDTINTAQLNQQNLSETVASETGDLVIDGLIVHDTTTVVGPGQTQSYNLLGDEARGAGSHEDGATSVTMSWTHGVEDEWAWVGLNINAAAAVGARAQNRLYVPQHYRKPVRTFA